MPALPATDDGLLAAEQDTEIKNDSKTVLRTNLLRLKSWADGVVFKPALARSSRKGASNGSVRRYP
ncbi:hypothetical protein BH09SUM1_BH09SUM1_00850 [soil metagenome]